MPEVIYEKRGHIAYITLNRPEAMNAISAAVWRQITDAWINVRDDNDVWVAIVTAQGEKAFCAGADLKEMAELRAEAEAKGLPYKSAMPDITPMRGLEVWKPFIAAVNGVALGGGCELVLACDIRIASENARFGVPEVRQGIIPGAGGTQRLPRFLPMGMALELLMTGDIIRAQEAYRIGLVNKVVPASELMPTAEALATRINENAPLAVRAAKEAAIRGSRSSLEEGLRLENLLLAYLRETADSKEGPRAFAEKRKPAYKAE